MVAEVVLAVSVVAPLLLLVVVLIQCLGCLRKKEGFKNFENEDSRMEARINPGFAMGQDIDETDRPTLSTTIQIEPLPELLSETTSRKPKIACVEKSKQETALKLVVVNNPHPFPRRQLKYLNEIGSGWFGQVLESDAEHITTGIPLSRVVAKVLKDEATNSEKKLFIEDVLPYRELEHDNVLRLLSQCTESSPYLMILEYAPMGDLKACVKQQKNRANADKYQLVKFAIDAASGLACLHRHGYIHQDFAARNCVVMADYKVKVGDYGISEDIYKEDYYDTGKEMLPVRWMSPESLSQQSGAWQTAVITKEANIWSFGVLLWEMLTYGSQPYTSMSDSEVLQNVVADRLVKLPEPDIDIQYKDRIFEVLQFCWLNPGQRPSIEEAHGLLNQLANIASGAQQKEENFEKKWNQTIPSEARVVIARPQTKHQKKQAPASFESNFSQSFNSDSVVTNEALSPQFDELTSVKVESGLSTSIVNMQSDASTDIDHLTTPFHPKLPALMTSTPVMDPVLSKSEADSSDTMKKSNTSGSKTSRKIEADFEKISVTVAEDGPKQSVIEEKKVPEVKIAEEVGSSPSGRKPEVAEPADPFSDILGDLSKAPDEQAKGAVKAESKQEPKVENTELDIKFQAKKDDFQDENVDLINAESCDESSKESNVTTENKIDLLDQSSSDSLGQNSGDLGGQADSDHGGQGDGGEGDLNAKDETSFDLLQSPSNGKKDSAAKCDMQFPVLDQDAKDSIAGLGKQLLLDMGESGSSINQHPALHSGNVDVVTSRNSPISLDKNTDIFVSSTFQPNETIPLEIDTQQETDETNLKTGDGIISDNVIENGLSGYETHSVDQSKSESNDENTSGTESSSDSAVCVSSPELAEAPSSFDGSAPPGEKRDLNTHPSKISSISTADVKLKEGADATNQIQPDKSKMADSSRLMTEQKHESGQGLSVSSPKPPPKDLNSAFEKLASQHEIGFDMFGSAEEPSTSEEQYNEFGLEDLGKSKEIDLFDDFPGSDNTSHKSGMPSVSAFFTGVEIPKVTGESDRSESVESVGPKLALNEPESNLETFENDNQSLRGPNNETQSFENTQPNDMIESTSESIDVCVGNSGEDNSNEQDSDKLDAENSTSLSFHIQKSSDDGKAEELSKEGANFPPVDESFAFSMSAPPSVSVTDTEDGAGSVQDMEAIIKSDMRSGVDTETEKNTSKTDDKNQFDFGSLNQDLQVSDLDTTVLGQSSQPKDTPDNQSENTEKANNFVVDQTFNNADIDMLSETPVPQAKESDTKDVRAFSMSEPNAVLDMFDQMLDTEDTIVVDPTLVGQKDNQKTFIDSDVIQSMEIPDEGKDRLGSCHQSIHSTETIEPDLDENKVELKVESETSLHTSEQPSGPSPVPDWEPIQTVSKDEPVSGTVSDTDEFVDKEANTMSETLLQTSKQPSGPSPVPDWEPIQTVSIDEPVSGTVSDTDEFVDKEANTMSETLLHTSEQPSGPSPVPDWEPIQTVSKDEPVSGTVSDSDKSVDIELKSDSESFLQPSDHSTGPSPVPDWEPIKTLNTSPLQEPHKTYDLSPESVSSLFDGTQPANTSQHVEDAADTDRVLSTDDIMLEDDESKQPDSLVDGFVQVSHETAKKLNKDSADSIAEDVKEPEQTLDTFNDDNSKSSGADSLDENSFLFLGENSVAKSQSNDSFSDVSDGIKDSSNLAQSIIDFPDSSMTDSQESAVFLDLSDNDKSMGEQTSLNGTEDMSHGLTESASTNIMSDNSHQHLEDDEDLSSTVASGPVVSMTQPEKKLQDSSDLFSLEPDKSNSKELTADSNQVGAGSQLDEKYLFGNMFPANQGSTDAMLSSDLTSGQLGDIQDDTRTSVDNGLLDKTENEENNSNLTGLLDFKSSDTSQMNVPQDSSLLDFSIAECSKIDEKEESESESLLALNTNAELEDKDDKTSGLGLLSFDTTDSVILGVDSSEGLLDFTSPETSKLPESGGSPGDALFDLGTGDMKESEVMRKGSLLDGSLSALDSSVSAPQGDTSSLAGGLLDFDVSGKSNNESSQVSAGDSLSKLPETYPASSGDGLFDLGMVDMNESVVPRKGSLLDESVPDSNLYGQSSVDILTKLPEPATASIGDGLLDFGKADMLDTDVPRKGSLLDSLPVPDSDNPGDSSSSVGGLLDFGVTEISNTDSIQSPFGGLLDMGGDLSSMHSEPNEKSYQDSTAGDATTAAGDTNQEATQKMDSLFDFSSPADAQTQGNTQSTDTSEDPFGGLLDFSIPSTTNDNVQSHVANTSDQTALLDIFGSTDSSTETPLPKHKEASAFGDLL